MNAPTTKVSAWIDTGLTIDLPSGVSLCARRDDPYLTEEFDPVTGSTYMALEPASYSITSHQGLMPAFHTDTFNTLQALANAMRDYADLRTWRQINHGG
jgi:hypothetical protein